MRSWCPRGTPANNLLSRAGAWCTPAVSWNALRAALLVGAAYDFVVGLLIAAALQLLSTILPIPFPTEPIYARLCGVLLMGLGAFYATTALTLPQSKLSVLAAIGIRTVGGGFLTLAPLVDRGIAPFLAVFGAVDLVFALWFWIALRAASRG